MNGDGYQSDFFLGSFGFPKIPHYYGDIVRGFFVLTAAIAVVALPIWGDLLPFGLIPQLVGILALAALAGLTSPHSEVVLWIDAIVAGLGVVVLEAAAVTFYTTASFGLFLAREVSAIFLLFAFYYSIKTVRAMSQGKLGHRQQQGEFK